MSPRLDAHAHFFSPGFVDQLPENCRRREPDEITLYQAHARRHDIEQVLAVGYEGDSWASGNNSYLAALATQYDWVRPTAFVAEPGQLSVEQLQAWQDQKFVGISLYLFSAEAVNQLNGIAGVVWQWLSDQAWLISVNSTADFWNAWPAILQRFPDVRLLIAHLGIPPAVTAAPPPDLARTALTSVLQ